MPPALLVTADGSPTLVRDDGHAYRSRYGAEAEVRHVFLEGSGVGARLRAGQATSVLEVGFGTGLSAFVTLSEATHADAPCHVVSLEADPVPAEVIATLDYGTHLGLPDLEARFLRPYAVLVTEAQGAHAFAFTPLHTLTLVIGDARMADLPGASFDAIYLDAFAPAVNPDLYAAPFLARLFAALKPGGRLATFVAQGAFRRALTSVGFAVEKRPGGPGKREMTVAVRPART
ncbi:MAG TPA: tRNA (5-methylaminomethyl-2-thiouridine)(34)-methyltransferase MnmD [Rhodothermales bacterium]|nr:tRNA (5-methylaminomethyl-2-thiouridine)(34)-methyltransferase MnmD [Rhodothermales bacterium]